ncbi:MAG: hypothetical protein CM15mP49_03460 [Actinomycetota bacterium]|nr:MAG: hypothetical protein CM15mP49_03460 [Actinomycetota bacterium]
MLFQALAKQDRNLMRTVARQSVQRFAGMEPGGLWEERTTCTEHCVT